MAYTIATVTGGLGDEAHYKVLAAIKTFLEGVGYTTLRYDISGADKELIMNSDGLSGTEDIYIGFKTYQSVASDYYNIAVACFTGYISGNTFEAQPGAKLSGVPCHNNAVTYFMTANKQRIAGCFKVGTPVYTHFYVGKMFPYGRPGEFPSPLITAGMFNGKEARRFSDISYQFPYYGAGVDAVGDGFQFDSMLWLRRQDGTWATQYHDPWRQEFDDGAYRPAGTDYLMMPIILYNNSPRNVWGELDGITQITGFNNGVENVLQQGGSSIVDQTGMTPLQAVDAIAAVGGKAHLILQDLNRTGFGNFIAMEMN